MAAILERQPPPLTEFQPLISAALDRTVRTCLAKDPGERWQTARDLLHALTWLAETGASTGLAGARPAAPSLEPANRIRPILVGVAGLVGVAALASVLWSRVGSTSAPADVPRVVRFSIGLPDGQVIPAEFNPHVALSPDGTTLAVTTLPGPVSLRRLDGLAPRSIEGTTEPGFRTAPMFSPDGSDIAFIEGNAIDSWSRPFFRAALSGGRPSSSRTTTRPTGVTGQPMA